MASYSIKYITTKAIKAPIKNAIIVFILNDLILESIEKMPQ